MKSIDNNITTLRLLKYLFSIFLVLLVIHLVLQYINTVHLNQTYGPFYELTNRFDFDDEMSIPTWYAQFLFIVLSASSALLAFLEKNKPSKNIWILLSISTLAGSIDEVSAVHESILQAIHLTLFDVNSPTLLANAWVVVTPLVVGAIVFFLYKVLKLLPRRTVQLFALSAFLYLSGAVAVDIASSALIESSAFVEQGLIVALEESLEILGQLTLFYALASYIEITHKSKISRVLQRLV